VNGSAAGEMELPAAIKPGTYILSAYTLWMLNFPQFISRQKIKIYNAGKAEAAAKANQKATAQVSLQFFPEGGQMITGLTSKLAFKTQDQWKRPLTGSGKIVNSKNEAVASFKTEHDGMGMVSFIPEAGETYSATLDDNRTSKRFALPAVYAEGINLVADNSNETKTFVKLERGEKNKDAYNNLLLVAQQNYEVVYMAKINFDEGEDAVAISKKSLKPGIMHITVFDNLGKIMAARSVFISNYSPPPLLKANVTPARRGKNTVSIDLSAFAMPDVSVSISNAAAETSPRENNIFSTLLLASDVPAAINAPAHYFTGKDSNTLQQLDMLMIIHGWSRFQWPDVLSYNFPKLQYPFETGLSVSGKVTQPNGKSSLPSGKINLVIKGEDSTTIMSEATVGANSEFVVADLDFKKSASIFYQGTNKTKTNALVSVKINPVYIDTLVKSALPLELPASTGETTPPPYLQALVSKKEKDDNARSKLLQEVVVISKKLSVADSVTKLYVSPLFEYSDQTLVMDDGHYFDIWQYLQRMVPGISIDKTESTPRINFSRYDGLSFFSSEGPASGVQLYLNEVPVSPEVADNLNPSDISLIKVYKGVTGIALGASRGAISIYTKKGVSTRDWRVRGFDFIKQSGYAVNRNFYKMDYSVLNPENSFSDVRPTLYWNPYVKLVDGKAIIEFYNDDISTQARIMLEGIDKNGKLISLDKVLE
jgi:hypothetical protein